VSNAITILADRSRPDDFQRVIAIVRKPFFWAARKGWYIRVNGDDGRLVTVRLADSRSDAYDEWDRMKTASRVVESHSPTLEAIIAAYLDDLRERARLGKIGIKTVNRRVDYLSPFLVRCGAIEVDKLKPHHVADWLTEMTTWNSTTQGDAASIVKRALKSACQAQKRIAGIVSQLRVDRWRRKSVDCQMLARIRCPSRDVVSIGLNCVATFRMSAKRDCLAAGL
jgi:hypothetical protein